jgi:DNA-binding transcriptional LysR family regulator
MAVAPGQRALPLFEEQAAFVVRRDHPLGQRRLTRELFNELPHIDVQVTLGRPGTGHRAAEQQFAAQRVHRRVVLTVPYFFTAALAAAHTDCVAGLPDRLARLYIQLLPLTIMRAAFPLPRLQTMMVWHERTDADPGARFFRGLIEDAVRRPSRAGRRAPSR